MLLELRYQTDPLTGALNRTGYEAWLARLGECEGAVLILTLDDFRLVHEAYGHATGDSALRPVVERLRDVLPPGAALVRYGGDEFAVAMPHCDQRRALQTANGLLETVGQGGFRLNGSGQLVPVHLSVGLMTGRLSRLTPSAGAVLWMAKAHAEVAERAVADGPQCDVRIRIAGEIPRTLGGSPDGFVFTDLGHRFLEVSPAYLEMACLPPDGWQGHTPRIVASGLTAGLTYAAMHREMARTGRWSGEFVNRRPDGALWWAEWSMVRRDLHGQPIGYSGSVRDRTAAHRSEAERLTGVVAEFCERHEVFIEEHLRRTGEYMALISREWQRRYGREGLDANPEELALAARLHDVGKFVVPAEILRKPRPLTETEHRTVQRHAEAGKRYVEGLRHKWQAESPEYLQRLLAFAAEIAGQHHEKWDGTGYPLGRAGEAIPVSARLLAVVDVYDALRSPRAYKGAWDEARTLRYIREQAGRSFDVHMVEVLLELVPTPEWQAIGGASPERSGRTRRPSERAQSVRLRSDRGDRE